MRLAMAQMSMTRDIDINMNKSLYYIEKAKRNDFLFFPEVQLTPFFPQYTKENLPRALGVQACEYALSRNDNRIHLLREAARESKIFLSPNLYIKDRDQYYDMSFLIGDRGEVRGVSKMVHILSAPHFYEKEYYTPSEEGFQVFDTPFGRIGIVICFDRHLPESIRTCALSGADLVIVPTANTYAEPLDLFEMEIRTQAYQNGVFVAMCNRVGKEDQMHFAGRSIVCSPDGEILTRGSNKEELIVCEIDLSQAAATRKARPYLSLRRTEFYK